jgi:hypothetical protein
MAAMDNNYRESKDESNGLGPSHAFVFAALLGGCGTLLRRIR